MCLLYYIQSQVRCLTAQLHEAHRSKLSSSHEQPPQQQKKEPVGTRVPSPAPRTPAPVPSPPVRDSRRPVLVEQTNRTPSEEKKNVLIKDFWAAAKREATNMGKKMAEKAGGQDVLIHDHEATGGGGAVMYTEEELEDDDYDEEEEEDDEGFWDDEVWDEEDEAWGEYDEDDDFWEDEEDDEFWDEDDFDWDDEEEQDHVMMEFEVRAGAESVVGPTVKVSRIIMMIEVSSASLLIHSPINACFLHLSTYTHTQKPEGRSWRPTHEKNAVLAANYVKDVATQPER